MSTSYISAEKWNKSDVLAIAREGGWAVETDEPNAGGSDVVLRGPGGWAHLYFGPAQPAHFGVDRFGANNVGDLVLLFDLVSEHEGRFWELGNMEGEE